MSGASAAESVDVAIEAAGGTLHGTLTVPATATPVPVVLILPGSGPTDRDGNQPGYRQDVYRLLAEGLAADGIASLRIDKRGVGASAAAMPSEEGVTVETYLADTVEWMEFLEVDDRFSSLSLIGHSEGALYAILAAENVPVSALILISGIGRPAADAIRWQLDRADMPAALREEAENALVALEAGRTVADPPESLSALLRPAIQPYLISWFAIDPVERLAELAVPALILHGATDLQVPVEDAKRLAAARADVNLVVLDQVNHILRKALMDRQSNFATYSNPDLPLAAAVMPPITDFIRKHTE